MFWLRIVIFLDFCFQSRRRRVVPGLLSTATPLRTFTVLEEWRSTLYLSFFVIFISHGKTVGAVLCGRIFCATHSDVFKNYL